MSQYSHIPEALLLVPDARGRYHPATADQILAAARQVIDQKMRRGADFGSPSDVKAYLHANLAAPENRNGDRVITARRDSLQDSANQAGQEMARRNMNIQPALTERPGLPVRIIVNRDPILRLYQPLFFNRGPQ